MEKALSATLRPIDYLAAHEVTAKSLIKPSKEFNQNYTVHRIGLSSLEIDQKVRDTMLEFMNQGKKFIQVDDHTIMLNSISSIEPLPIKPKPEKGHYEDNVWMKE